MIVAADAFVVMAFTAAIANYVHKRAENAKAMSQAVSVTETRALSKKVDELSALQESVANQAQETKKQHEEMKKVLSSASLYNSFKPPVRRNQAQPNVVG